MPNPFIAPAARAALLIAALCLAACQTTSHRSTPPELKLLETAPLVLPQDCFASGSFIVAFVVTPTGRTDEIRASDAPPCVQQALSAWVASFRYEPPAAATPATMEWMLVTAKRGS